MKKTRHSFRNETYNLNHRQVHKRWFLLHKKTTSPAKKEEVHIDQTRRPKAHLLTTIMAGLVSLLVIIGLISAIIGFNYGLGLLEGMPEYHSEDLKSQDSTIIYDADGNILQELGEYKRENVEYEDLPNVLIDAFLAIEDSRYFEHFGFDIPRFLKALLENIKAGDFEQGGSTFTMQLIKNTYFQKDDGEDSTLAEKKLSRKAQEIILAIKADRDLSKKEILTDYLNRINFGNNIRGIEKAANYYFDISASELNLSKAAFLAGIINSPNIYNPYNNLIKDSGNIYVNPNIDYLANGQRRRDEVIDMMLYHGYISENEARLAKMIDLEDELARDDDKWNEVSPYYQSYIDAVVEEVKDITGKDPYYSSMKIYTSMDPTIQKTVYDLQNENTYIRYPQANMQSAIVVLNNQNGKIIALGGGREEEELGARHFNRATMAKLQPGSTIKPIFEYLLAFNDLGWATSHVVDDKPVYLYDDKDLQIYNADGKYRGKMLLKDALGNSLNSPAVQALEDVVEAKGIPYVVDYLNSIGIKCSTETFDLQYAIGGSTLQVTPLQLAASHAIILNGGRYIKPHTVDRIVVDGETIYEPDTIGEQVVKPGAAYMMAQLEYNNVYGPYLNLMNMLRTGYPVYAKTGTTDWGDSGLAYGIPKGAARDNWQVASTDTYTNVVWLGWDKMGYGTYFYGIETTKGDMARYLLDAEYEHFNYDPGYVKKPDDVTSIKTVWGSFPYRTSPFGNEGYILKEFYPSSFLWFRN